jgi:hypothetical protein
MFTGFNTGDALASIYIPNINCCSVQPTLDLIEVQTESGKTYRFRSQQKGDVARWASAIINGTMAGMESYNIEDDEIEGANAEDAIWQKLGQKSLNSGGVDSAISKPADKLEESEDMVLQELFLTIVTCNGPKKMPDPENPSRMIDADFFDSADLMKWCSNRFALVRDQKQKTALEEIVNFETIESAVDGCMRFDEDGDARLTYPIFRRGMCEFTSEIRRVVLTMLNTFAKMEDWQYLEKVTGELTTADYILMYHQHLQQVVKACRKQLHEKDEDQIYITNKEKMVQVYLNGIEKEVAGLLKKFEDYNNKLRSFQPSLRERNHVAIDDTFDDHLLDGERWDSVSPRKSWK